MQKKDSFESDVSDVYRARLLKQINIIKDNKIPVDLKGNEEIGRASCRERV